MILIYIFAILLYFYLLVLLNVILGYCSVARARERERERERERARARERESIGFANFTSENMIKQMINPESDYKLWSAGEIFISLL